MFDPALCQIQEIILLMLDLDHSQDLFPDLDLEISISQLNVIIVTTWVTQQIIASDVKIKISHIDNLIKVGEILTEMLKDIQITDQILDLEQLTLLSVESISQNHQCIQIYMIRESMISIDSVVSTFKQTSDPIEEVFQMQNDNVIKTDYPYIHSEPLDIYSRQILDDENVQDTVYGTDEEFNTLFYDIEQSSDTEASEQQSL